MDKKRGRPKGSKNKPKVLECDGCGQPGKETICPYDMEINNTETECVLCDNCYHERCMDI